MRNEFKKFDEAITAPVDLERQHATDRELDAMLMLARLDPEERRRIVRWAIAKWGIS